MTEPFFYQGLIPASKSILNRLLVIQSFEPSLRIDGDTQADDVVRMKSALFDLLNRRPADCGAAGTTFRFLALRASRIPGEHVLRGAERLLSRPQDEILSLLTQLGCSGELSDRTMVIRSDGWNVPSKGISIDQSVSSQFASALALSAWKLPVPLIVRGHGKVVSESYFAMTQQLLSRAGMEIRYEEPGSFTVPAGSSVRSGQIVAEIDVSSAFAIAAFAALKGKAVFQRWPSDSLQPDAIFTSLLSRMGCRVIVSSGTLEVSSPEDRLVSIEHDLRNAPDLFPVLATLCALAKGKSRLFGAPHLKHKESDRREKTRELIQGLGRACNPIEGGLEIHGRPPEDGIPSKKVRYDTDHDHRLAFAAALAKRAGLNIDILHPEVVSKSFPEFWALTEASA